MKLLILLALLVFPAGTTAQQPVTCTFDTMDLATMTCSPTTPTRLVERALQWWLQGDPEGRQQLAMLRPGSGHIFAVTGRRGGLCVREIRSIDTNTKTLLSETCIKPSSGKRKRRG